MDLLIFDDFLYRFACVNLLYVYSCAVYVIYCQYWESRTLKMNQDKSTIELQGWVFGLAEDRLLRVLNSLELNATGTVLVRRQRLIDRLQGNESSTEFQQEEEMDSQEDLQEQRPTDNLASSSIEDTSWPTRTTNMTPTTMSSPKEAQPRTITTTAMVHSAMDADPIENRETRRQDQQDAQIMELREIISDLSIALEHAEERASAYKRMVEERPARMDFEGSTAASSTKIAQEPQNQRRSNVNFRDTFSLNYISENEIQDRQGEATADPRQGSSNTTRSTKPHRQTSNSPWMGNPGGGETQTRAVLESPRNPVIQRTFQELPRMRDVGDTVRRWQIQFSGSKGQSIEEFLTRVQECRLISNITDEELLLAIPHLMRGIALQWCRLSQPEWRTWKDFCKDARRCYGVDRNFQQRLMAEANTRTQGPEEPVRDFIICLRTILQRCEPPLTKEQQLELTYRNLRPDIQAQVRREDVRSCEDLLSRAMEAERVQEMRKYYRPPPSADLALLPETAYRSTKETGTLPKKTEIAAISETTAAEIARIMDKKFKEWEARILPHRATGPRERNLEDFPDPTARGAPDQRGYPERSNHYSPPRTSPHTAIRGRTFTRSPQDRQREKECWRCHLPGYTKFNCPRCNPKGQGSAEARPLAPPQDQRPQPSRKEWPDRHGPVDVTRR